MGRQPKLMPSWGKLEWNPGGLVCGGDEGRKGVIPPPPPQRFPFPYYMYVHWARIETVKEPIGIDPPSYIANGVVVLDRQAGNRFLGSWKGLQIRALLRYKDVDIDDDKYLLYSPLSKWTSMFSSFNILPTFLSVLIRSISHSPRVNPQLPSNGLTSE
jgi:hypothetical protein